MVSNQAPIVESAREARQAEPGLSVLLLLLAGLALAAMSLVAIWTVFFRP